MMMIMMMIVMIIIMVMMSPVIFIWLYVTAWFENDGFVVVCFGSGFVAVQNYS
jgi:hypothetical protein